MRNLKTSVGTTAKGGTSVAMISKFRSGIFSPSHLTRFRPDLLKEPGDGVPDLCSASQAAPRQADQADKAVTGIDRNNIIIACTAQAIDEQRLDIGGQVAQNRIIVDERLPFLQLKQRLGGPCRTGIVGHHRLCPCAGEEEGHIDRYMKTFPLLVSHMEVWQGQVASWYEPVLASAGPLLAEEHGAGLANADQLTVAKLQQMGVARGDDLAAQFAAFRLRACGPLP